MSTTAKQNLSTNILVGGDIINDFLRNRIKKALIDKDWTYDDLANAVGASEPTIRTFMSRSGRDMPNVEKKVKEVLKLD